MKLSEKYKNLKPIFRETKEFIEFDKRDFSANSQNESSYIYFIKNIKSKGFWFFL